MDQKKQEKNLKTNQKIPAAQKRQPTPPFITTDLEQPQGLNAYFENISQNAQGSPKKQYFYGQADHPPALLMVSF